MTPMAARSGVVTVALAVVLAACGSSDGRAATTPSPRPVHLARRIVRVATDEVDPTYNQGIAGNGRTWILSGTTAMAHAAPTGAIVSKVDPAIPPEWAAQGYDHVGDVDVVGDTLYVPFEQGDYARDEQAMARYDAATLRFRGATPVHQHHNSFVTVDPVQRIAYSTDWFDDDALLRYDLDHDWKPLPPLPLSRTLSHIQGGAVGGGQFFVSTDDDRNGVYGVDLRTGTVRFLGSTGHGAGEGEGIAYARTGPRGAVLHTVTVDVKIAPVYVDHWRIVR
jgi:hypothetical protein